MRFSFIYIWRDNSFEKALSLHASFLKTGVAEQSEDCGNRFQTIAETTVRSTDLQQAVPIVTL